MEAICRKLCGEGCLLKRPTHCDSCRNQRSVLEVINETVEEAEVVGLAVVLDHVQRFGDATSQITENLGQFSAFQNLVAALQPKEQRIEYYKPTELCIFRIKKSYKSIICLK